MWLLLSILLVAGEFLQDSQFPPLNQDFPEAAQYVSLWVTRDAMQIHEAKIFWILMEVSVQMWINKWPCLSPMVYNSMWSFADFKADMHNVYIMVWKDPE